MRTGVRRAGRSSLAGGHRSPAAGDQGCASRNVADVHEFCSSTGGAARIFQYVHTQPDLRDLNLEFGYGMVQGPRRAVARFSGRSIRPGSHVLVWVMAEAAADGGWLVRHSLLWGE